MAPALAFLVALHRYIDPDIADIGQTSSGARMIANVVHRHRKPETSEIEAQVVHPSADWPTMGLSGECMRIDARLQYLYISYTALPHLSSPGVLEFDENTRTSLDESRTNPTPSNCVDTTWFTKLDVVTTDRRLKWFQTEFLISQGRSHVDDKKGIAAENIVYQLS